MLVRLIASAFGGTISSYTWICMILNFLQTRKPPILPSLQKAPELHRLTKNGQKSPFADDLDQIRGCGKNNKESLAQLLFHFFRYYGYEIDYAQSVVSVKEGRLLSRKEKGWDASNYKEKEARSRLCVEEPFNTDRNLGNSADDYAFSGIHGEIRRAFELIAQGKLDECCEQYEFPPEEKTIFQRPTPKPKPTLTRSASQSGRPHANSVNSRPNNNGSRSSRNTSNHRSNNRRASSGAAYGNQQRFPYVPSPAGGINGMDYFAMNGMTNGLPNGISNGISTDLLHEQLYKQYQFLQAQQEALRTQLLQQQQTQAQMQGQGQTPQSLQFGQSPRQRHFANSLSSPRVLENPPNTAPLLPGYLYHYPARYPPPSPLAQTRSQDSASTNPSSPTGAGSIRRGAHRGSVPEIGSIPSVRSQSQPGRAFPNPVTLQSLAHPGYDVSGAIGSPFLVPRSMQNFHHQQQNRGDVPTTSSHVGSMMPTSDTAMPKEYVGYYMGQSPQLAPHFPSGHVPYAPILRDPPPTARRVSPEYLPPVISNGTQRQSRSPSPLAHQRNSSTSPNVRSAPLPQMPFPDAPKFARPAADSGPVIVNGSNASTLASSTAAGYQRAADVTTLEEAVHGLGLGVVEGSSPALSNTMTPKQILPFRSSITQQSNGFGREPVIVHTPSHSTLSTANAGNGPSVEQSRQAPQNGLDSPQRISPKLRAKPPRLNLSPNSEAMRDTPGQALEQVADISPLVPPSILSPVAEMRTPSPTSSKWAGSPSSHMAGSVKPVQIVNGTHKTKPIFPNGVSKLDTQPLKPFNTQHSEANARSAATATTTFTSPSNESTHNQPVDSTNAWQQATRKGHKKSKSASGSKIVNGLKNGGEPMPANEADRKGG